MYSVRKYKPVLIGALLIASAAIPVSTAQKQADTANMESTVVDDSTLSDDPLLGTWDVSLYFSATAPPSSTVMEVTSVNDDGTFEGTFYDTAFEAARFTSREGVTAFSIITRDGSGVYATSGRLQADGRIEGQTFATGREFLMMWSAQRR